MTIDIKELPDELPVSPAGWIRKLVLHLNLGSKGGIGTYRVFDDKEREMPIIFAYGPKDTPPGFNFTNDPEKQPRRSWAELRAAWPEWIAKARTKGAT
jgi:hypothetical protein